MGDPSGSVSTERWRVGGAWRLRDRQKECPRNRGLSACLQRSVETSQTGCEEVSEASRVGASPKRRERSRVHSLHAAHRSALHPPRKTGQYPERISGTSYEEFAGLQGSGGKRLRCGEAHSRREILPRPRYFDTALRNPTSCRGSLLRAEEAYFVLRKLPSARVILHRPEEGDFTLGEAYFAAGKMTFLQGTLLCAGEACFVLGKLTSARVILRRLEEGDFTLGKLTLPQGR
jgi:hypothetical protein